MADWIAAHRQSITFVVWQCVGITLLAVGVFGGDGDPALVALGAGAVGLPGFSAATRQGDK